MNARVDLETLRTAYLRGLLADKPDLLPFAEPGGMFRQLRKFPEGSVPMLDSPRGKVVDIILHDMLKLASNTFFKGAMDGFSQLAGGLLLLVRRKDGSYRLMLAKKGDPFNPGKIGVIGGQASDKDEGDTRLCTERETGQETNLPIDLGRLIPLVRTLENRNAGGVLVDGRMEAYPILSDFYLYVVDEDEAAEMMAAFREHVAKNPDRDPEVESLHQYRIHEVLEMIRDGKIAYYDQTAAFVMLALCIRHVQDMPQPTARVWRVAAIDVEDEYKRIIDLSQGDWRPKLDVLAVMGNKFARIDGLL